MILDRAVAWWHADKFDPDTDTQWLDQSGNAHHAQFGSTSGADSNDPTFLEYSGTQYLFLLNATSDRGISSASHPARADGGDLEAIVDVELDGYDKLGYYFSKYNATTNLTYSLRQQPDGTLIFYWTESGSTLRFPQSTAALPASAGDRVRIKVTLDVDNGAGGYDVKFYYQNVTNGDPGYTQLGSTVTGGATTNVTDTATIFRIGQNQTGTMVKAGKWYRVTLKNGIGGTAFFDADFTSAAMISPGDASFTELSANGDSMTVYRGTELEPVVVNRNLFMFGGDDYFEVADHADLDIGVSDDATAYAVFRGTQTTSGTQVLVSKRQGSFSSNAGWDFVLAGSDVYARISDGFGQSGGNRGLTLTPGEHGGGFAHDNGVDITPFGDGTGAAPVTDNETGSYANAQALRFGAYGGGTNYFIGALIGVAFFKEELSAADMATLHAELIANHTGTVLDGAVAWWHADRYDPDVDTQWLDQSGNGHHAQLGSTSGADTNDPTFLPYNDAKYMYFTAPVFHYISGGGTSTSNKSGTKFEFIAKISMPTWRPSAGFGFIWDNAQTAVLIKNTDGKVRLRMGGQNYESTVALDSISTPTFPAPLWLKITVTNSGVVQFYYDTTDGTSYTQLGSDVAFSGNWGTGTSTYNVIAQSASLSSGTNTFPGGIFSVEVGEAGSTRWLDVDLENDTEIVPGVSSFTADTGGTFTVTRGAFVEPVVVNRNRWLYTGDDYHSVTDHADLDFNAQSFTIAIAMRKILDTASVTVLAKQTGVAGVPGYTLQVQSDETPLLFTATPIRSDVGPDISAVVDDFTLIGVGSSANSTTELFTNGVPSGSPWSDSLVNMTNAVPLFMGAQPDSPPHSYHKGEIIGAAVFRSALSDADVAGAHIELLSDLRILGITHEATASVSLTATASATPSTERGGTATAAVVATVSATPAMEYGAASAVSGTVTTVASPSLDRGGATSVALNMIAAGTQTMDHSARAVVVARIFASGILSLILPPAEDEYMFIFVEDQNTMTLKVSDEGTWE